MHVQQWDNSESGGGGPFDPSTASYSVEVAMFDDGAAHKIGFLSRANAPVNISAAKNGDPPLSHLAPRSSKATTGAARLSVGRVYTIIVPLSNARNRTAPPIGIAT
jgi:hypothetical protein